MKTSVYRLQESIFRGVAAWLSSVAPLFYVYFCIFESYAAADLPENMMCVNYCIFENSDFFECDVKAICQNFSEFDLSFKGVLFSNFFPQQCYEFVVITLISCVTVFVHNFES